MPRFYFNLASNDAHIPDHSGKELKTLHDAYAHARKLIDKILLHVGHDDAEAWKVVILNDEHDAQMILPFSVSQTFGRIIAKGSNPALGLNASQPPSHDPLTKK